MPLVDRPLIQYAVEEAVAAGSERIVLVSAPGKESILRHFRRDAELESFLERAGRTRSLAMVRHAGTLATVDAVMQPEPLGVGHAILQASPLVGEGPFGVMFPDDFIVAQVPVLEQLRRVHEQYGGIVIAVERVPHDEIERYGVIDGEQVDGNVVRVSDLVEKPARDRAPSDLAIVGRYILPGEIFRILADTPAGVGGEIQITDAIRAALTGLPCHAVVFEGQRFDCGSKLGFLQATIEVARRHEDLGAEFSRYLERVSRQRRPA